MRKSDGSLTTVFLLVSILLAFAGNSILVRAALAGAQIDWAGYTIVRLVAGALMLCVLFTVQKRKPIMPGKRDVAGALSLFVYAAAFSWAYVRLDAGIGALILFPAGQITMQLIGLFRGVVPTKGQLAGVIIALGGLIYLMAPGASAPPLASAILMARERPFAGHGSLFRGGQLVGVAASSLRRSVRADLARLCSCRDFRRYNLCAGLCALVQDTGADIDHQRSRVATFGASDCRDGRRDIAR